MSSASIVLRPTAEADIPFLLLCEADVDTAPYIIGWSAQQHLDAIRDPDCRHVLIVDAATGRASGFAMLFGLGSPHHSIELRRIVCSVKGRGIGRTAMAQLKRLAFVDLGAHRLWLDVKQSNQRAQHLYRSTGFVDEGCLRECLLEAGRYESLLVMSLLRHEWAD